MTRPLCVFFLLAILAACDDPGEGPRFEAGRKEAETVVAAIRTYKEEYGSYPEKLDELSPKYFSKKFFEDHLSGKEISFFYQKKSENEFLFEFVYSNPGRNRCGYIMDSNPVKWNCWGHY